MVSCNLFGRYGNQLFQVSATIAYALKHNMPYSIPKHGLNFGKKTDYIFPNQRDIQINNVYTQPNHGYNEIPYFENVRLNGHFQSEKYFEGFRDEIRMALGFECATIYDCAVHIRRGDYVGQENRFPVLSLEYYVYACNKMKGIYHNVEFTIFSDDIEWCKKQAFFFNNIFSFHNSGNDIEDLKEMAKYKYMIIANSSYSLFASLINEKEYVIAPKHESWFGKDIRLKTEDLLPERFIQI